MGGSVQRGPQPRRLPAAVPEATARAARGSPGAAAGTPAMLLARGALDADEAPAPAADATPRAASEEPAPAPLDAPDPLPVAHPEPPAMPALDVPFDAPAFPGDLRSFYIMVKEANPPGRFGGPSGWFLDIMEQRCKKQCRADRTIGVERVRKVFRKLLPEAPNAEGQQSGEQVIRIVGAIARG